MTSKSEELCRLLGIEPKRIYWGGSGDGIEVYPDLTKPSNFVKLLEMQPFKLDKTIADGDNEETLWHIVSQKICTGFNRNDFIENLIICLSCSQYKFRKPLIRLIVEQAQNQSWEY